jgi:predicted Zn-dependent protease
VNTGGDFTNLGAEFGAMSFSQDFEREADYVGMYLLARADRPIANAADFWRRMAQESPGSIKFASSHPTTAERFVRLENAAAEIEQKRTAGAPLMPEMKTTKPVKEKGQ